MSVCSRGDFLRSLGAVLAVSVTDGCRILPMSDAGYLDAVRQRAEEELFGNVVPFWMRHSVDRAYGGFITCLCRDGTPYDTFKQMWMQWREVWMFARLAQDPRGGEKCLQQAVQGYDFLHRHGRKKDGGYWYMLDRQGNPIGDTDGGQEVFTESFAAIGSAELYRATGDVRYRREAENAARIYHSKTAHAESPSAAFPKKPTYVQLAYPMIDLNVLQIMRAAFGGGYEREIDSCVARIRRFTHPQSKLLFERAPADGGFDLSTQYGRFVNPGHALEGCVFMMRRLREKPDGELAAYLHDETLRMLDWGLDRADGGIYYGTDALDLPQARNDVALKAWWPQAEAMTASLSAYELTGDRRFLDYHRQVDDFTTRCLRDPDYPEWFAYAAVNGRQVHSYKGSRFKGFFHVPRCLADTLDVCERLAHRKATDNQRRGS